MIISTFLASATVILLPMFGTLPELGQCSNPYQGAYVLATDTIYVCDNGDASVVKFNTFHELAHSFWHTKLTIDERNEYTNSYKNAKNFYRDYSKTNEIEDFADNFALVALNKKVPKIKDRLSLIKKYANSR